MSCHRHRARKVKKMREENCFSFWFHMWSLLRPPANEYYLLTAPTLGLVEYLHFKVSLPSTMRITRIIYRQIDRCVLVPFYGYELFLKFQYSVYHNFLDFFILKSEKGTVPWGFSLPIKFILIHNICTTFWPKQP